MCWEALDRAGSAATLRAKGRIWETLQDAHSSASCTRPAAAAASFFANTALTTLPIDLQGAVQHTESHTVIIPTQDGLLKSVSRPFWQLEQDNQSPLVVFGVGKCTCPFLGWGCSVAVHTPLSKLLSCSGHAVLLHEHLVLLLLLLQHEVCKLLLLLAVLFSCHAACPRCILHSAVHGLRLEPASSKNTCQAFAIPVPDVWLQTAFCTSVRKGRDRQAQSTSQAQF